MHRRLTSVVVLWSGASVIVWSSALPRALHRICLGVTLLALSVGAHYGGSMTHGEGYLVEKAPAFVRRLFGAQKEEARNVNPVAAPGGSLVFDDLVLPIFRDKCVGCHGASAVKGKLRLDSFDAVMKGGAGGPVVVPHASRESRLVERIVSAADAEGHMPPKSKPQLTPDDVDLVRWWIDRIGNEVPAADAGAPLPDAGAEIADAGAPDGAAPAVDAGAAAVPAASSTSTAKKKPTGDRYTTVIQPILARRCGSCHGGARPASKLVITDRAALLAKVVVPGNPGGSSLVTRMTLPLDDDDHMPPSNKPQPSASEIAAIKSWIASGASGPESPAPAASSN
jgi:mono/diheme cytochrome c family protein